MTHLPLRVLSIAGSDPTAGAGVQADLKTFAAHGAYGLTAITAITVQSTCAVLAIEALDPDLVQRQILAVCEEFDIDAVKIGMLASCELVSMVAACLADLSGTPIVLDPVMQSSGGAELLPTAAREALLKELFPLASVVTPNTLEAAVLVGHPVETEAEQRQAAVALCEHTRSVVVTGGHRRTEDVVDLLSAPGGIRIFRSERLDVHSAHGTGCALSSAIAVHLGRGLEVEEAVERAIEYVGHAIREGFELGGGRRALNHFATSFRRTGSIINE